MARSARSSALKVNNQKLKIKVFGPVEAARAERLSAKLLEIVKTPKPVHDVKMDEVVEDTEDKKEEDEEIDIDSAKSTTSKTSSSKRVQKKRRGKKSSIVFKTYKDRSRGKK